MQMGKNKVISTIAFVAIAMVSGGIVSMYEMNKNSLDVKGAAQAKTVDVVQTEDERTTQAEVHQYGLCGIDGCMQMGEHSHGRCDVAECTETEAHMHNGEYCYPHSADDGHAYHNCGVSGCTEVESHTHNSCGVSGCMQTGEHSHGGNGGGHHQSGHGGGHH